MTWHSESFGYAPSACVTITGRDLGKIHHEVAYRVALTSRFHEVELSEA
ncbi:hypothetical protein [Streptomyces sp. AC512_CC834]|nr:hypothetical protein [Streptomyces sp. AC512_CC834]